MKKKKLVSLFLCVVMILSCLPAAVFAGGADEAEAAVFADIPDNWARAGLLKAVENGLISGYEENGQKLIKPEANLSRAELAAIVNRAFGAVEEADISSVQDIASDAWYAKEIAKAVKMGTLAEDSRMRPDDPVTRQEAAAILARAMNLSDGSASALASFADQDMTAAWARESLAAMVTGGYMSGSQTGSGYRLNPSGNITRAEFAVLMDNLIKHYIKPGDDLTGETLTGNVMINMPGVELKNVSIQGDLILGDSLASGTVTLDGVTVGDRLLVRGGTESSILIKGESTFGAAVFASGVASFTVPGTGGDSKLPEEGTTEAGTAEEEKTSSSSRRSSGGGSGGNETKTPEIDESYALRNVRVMRRGTAIGDIQLGFEKPEPWKDDINAYMMTFSIHELDDVWEALWDKNRAEINAIADPDSARRGGYIITNLSYADGTANTFRTNQKDLITGKLLGEEFGSYHFYVVTLGAEGVLSIAEADDTIDFLPGPLDFELTRDGAGFDTGSYSVSLRCDSNKAVSYSVTFYSEWGGDVVAEKVKNLSAADIDEMVKAGTIQYVGTSTETMKVSLDAELKDLDGAERRDDIFYYVYALSVGETGAQGLVKADRFMVPQSPAEPALTSIGNGPGQGAVMPAGGSTSLSHSSSNHVTDYLEAVKQDMDDVERPRVAVLETSSGVENLMYDYFFLDGDGTVTIDGKVYGDNSDYANLYKSGFEAVYIPLGIDNYESVANDQYFADLVRTCHGVLLMGGDQAYHARGLLNDDGSLTKVGEAIAEVYEIGGVVAGTSAGAAVMSNPVFQSGNNNSYETLFWNETEIMRIGDYNGKTDPEVNSSKSGNNIAYDGTGYVEMAAGYSVLIDTHFDVRGRFGRLAVALRDLDSDGIAMGLDEGTALRITGNIGTVVGRGGVFILDGSSAQWSEAGQNTVFRAEEFTLHYLTAGDTFDFTTKEAFPAAEKTAVAETDSSIYSTTGAFGTYDFSKVLITFAGSDKEEVTRMIRKASGSPFASGPDFEITLAKTSETVAYESNTDRYSGGSPGQNLSSYQKTFVSGILVTIGEEGTTGSGAGTEPPETPEPGSPQYAPQVTMAYPGLTTYDVRVRFLPPDRADQVEEYIMVYSVEEEESVWDYLKDLTMDEIEELGDQLRGRIVPKDWADGGATRFSPSSSVQILDVVTEQGMDEPGVYHFYVVSLNDSGALGIGEADETIEIE